jgi:hypothetical protein
MRKKMIVVWLAVGAAAIAAGYLTGQALIRLQDRNDPPVTKE